MIKRSFLKRIKKLKKIKKRLKRVVKKEVKNKPLKQSEQPYKPHLNQQKVAEDYLKRNLLALGVLVVFYPLWALSQSFKKWVVLLGLLYQAVLQIL